MAYFLLLIHFIVLYERSLNVSNQKKIELHFKQCLNTFNFLLEHNCICFN